VPNTVYFYFLTNFYQISIALDFIIFTDRPIFRPGRYLGFIDMSVSAGRPKQPILSAPVGVDKTLLYPSRIQTTCARKHNEPSQDSYLAATLAGAFS